MKFLSAGNSVSISSMSDSIFKTLESRERRIRLRFRLRFRLRVRLRVGL